jgi:protein phosphatase inhibitor 2
MSSTPEAAAAAIPVKPALKQHSSDDAVAETVPPSKHKKGGGAKKKKESRHLKWDEAKIQEHDQLRGTRMKIEEPNTPYHQYDSGSETDGSLSSAKKYNDSSTQISWDALTNKLEAHAAVKEAYPSSPSSHGGNQTEDDADASTKKEAEMKDVEFKEHRKRHYNEMELVRKFRQEHPDGLMADTEDNNGDDDENDADDENE